MAVMGFSASGAMRNGLIFLSIADFEALCAAVANRSSVAVATEIVAKDERGCTRFDCITVRGRNHAGGSSRWLVSCIPCAYRQLR